MKKRVEFGTPFFQEITLEWAHGRCAWFALAAAHHWKLPLLGFKNEQGDTIHVAVESKQGLFDAYGLGTIHDVLDAFKRLGAEIDLYPVALSVADVCEEFAIENESPEVLDAIDVCHKVLSEIGVISLS